MIRQTAVAFALASILAGQAAAAQAGAAQLTAIKGQVLVSRDGKITAAAPGALKAGDRVVSKAGQAQLRYADGCVVALKPQGMATIAAKSPCAGGEGLVNAGPTSAQAATQPPVAAAPAKTGLSVLEWAGVGLTAVVLGVGLAAAADDVSISN